MSTPACTCDKMCASATSTGTALVQTGDVVTASASATACSSVSYKRALSMATAESKQIAESCAIHDAHVINQTLRIINAHSLIPSNADLTVGSKETPFSQSFSVDGFAQNSISIGNEVALTSLDKKLVVNGAQTFTATNRQGSELDPIGTYYGYGALGQYPASSSKQSVNLKDASSGANNTAYGDNTLSSNTTGSQNTAIGYDTLYHNSTGSNNSAVGFEALYLNKTGNGNSALGVSSLHDNTTGTSNSAVGYHALYYNTTGSNNASVGYGALFTNTEGSNNSALGVSSLYSNTTGTSNSAVGCYALYFNTTGSNNAAVGYNALFTNTEGSNNTAVGHGALSSNKEGSNNSALGNFSLNNNLGNYNSAVGNESLYFNTTGSKNSALGLNSNSTSDKNYDNTTCLGANSVVSDSNQVQLGSSSTTTYCYGAVQDRSDKRDKVDIIDTQLGLDFINKLHPVDFKWNYRESYKEFVKQENGKPKIIEHSNDGSKKRNRYHHGLIAQEVKEVMNSLNVDFGGYQDHAVNGGEDALTIGYGELITPLIKAIQEMNVKIQEINAQNQELTELVQEMKNNSIITRV